MPSIFTKIVNGEIPCYKIAETENCLAFLDINPLKRGHTLVIPKKEIDCFYDVEDDLLAELMLLSKKVAIAIKKAVPCRRVGLTIIGIEVAHTHFHLIPLDKVSDMNFANEKLKLTPEEFKQVQEEIIRHL
ncbi:MAG TPA: HIT domain-containing protein [Bacteroidia bacterium]|jgi:histidine triad (HIT) family protein|nr:HIT domain-containing protein [Bacteroidia bacterium]